MFQPDNKTSADLMTEVVKSGQAEQAKGPQIAMRSVVANENRPVPSHVQKIPTYDAPAARTIAWEDDEYFYVFED